MKWVFKNQDLQMNMGICQPLEVVCRGSETQLQVGDNLSYLTKG